MKPRDEAATSRRLLRTSWAATKTDEESRAYLQSRLAVLFAIMFWSLLALAVDVALQFRFFMKHPPEHRGTVFAMAIVGLVGMVFIWRGLLVRRPLSVVWLYRIDLVYAIGIGTAFGLSALVQYDLRAAGYMSLVYSMFTVFARALMVPSSGLRTAITSTLTYIPMTISALVLALTTTEDLPGHSFFLGYLLLSIVPIVLASFGSKIIYGLRRQVSAARQLGQYTLEKQLGEGGMGTVYRAHHVLLRRPTAVKLLLPDRVGIDNLRRFEREVQHMSQLTHPNTVAVFDYGRSHDGVFYYAMEDLGGGIDLERLVRSHGPQPSARVAHVLAQVCGALQEAHDLGIVHRDIKPANIILCERGGVPDVAKVVDFGLVKEITEDVGGSSGHTILGTPGYIAPEAITEPDRVGPAVDLYALGAVGYFLASGKRVFEGKTVMDICIQHVTGTPRPIAELAPDLDPALAAILMRCLARTPGDRHASATDLADALAGVAAPWSEATARAWWAERSTKAEAHAALAGAATLTIPIDLAARAL